MDSSNITTVEESISIQSVNESYYMLYVEKYEIYLFFKILASEKVKLSEEASLPF